MEQHKKNVRQIQQQISDQNKKQRLLTLTPHFSNTTRSSTYKKNTNHINIESLNRIISIDPINQIALVEPKVTMQQLHLATFREGLLVPVIPEFTEITVAGAIMGAALESSSHLHGQFNDICTGYQVILGDGSEIWTSAEENPELFYALPGSYGSLGLIVLIQIQLVPATDWVLLTYHSATNLKEAFTLIDHLKHAPTPPDYLEGVVFSSERVIIIEGRRTSSKLKGAQITLSRSWDPWYYQHISTKTSFDGKELIPLTDYLFRYDRGAFWMGAYATHLPLFFRYLTEGVLGLRTFFSPWDEETRRSQFKTIKDPNFFFRFVLGWMMSSKRLYGLLHSGSEGWFEDKFVIQDFYIPEKNAETFLIEVLNRYRISPIWLCPVRRTIKPQLFSPHYQTSLSSSNQDFIDIGIYGLPQGSETLIETTRNLEKMTSTLGGRKMLYSHSYYSLEDFWKIYPELPYRKLRDCYQATNHWISIEDKILSPFALAEKHLS